MDNGIVGSVVESVWYWAPNIVTTESNWQLSEWWHLFSFKRFLEVPITKRCPEANLFPYLWMLKIVMENYSCGMLIILPLKKTHTIASANCLWSQNECTYFVINAVIRIANPARFSIHNGKEVTQRINGSHNEYLREEALMKQHTSLKIDIIIRILIYMTIIKSRSPLC